MKRVPDGPSWGNCPSWALHRWLSRGGYIGLRFSDHVRSKPHFIWSSTGQYPWGYIPKAPQRGFHAILHSYWFSGRIKRDKAARHRTLHMDRSCLRLIQILHAKWPILMLFCLILTVGYAVALPVLLVASVTQRIDQPTKFNGAIENGKTIEHQ